jgi:hypothetical protein
MKKVTTNDNRAKSLLAQQISRLVVKPLSDLMKVHAAKGLKHAERILEKIQNADSSIEIIARELARKAKRGK